MARTEEWFGLAGVAWLSGSARDRAVRRALRRGRDRAEPLVAMPLTAVALFAMQNGLSMRPQVISYLLVAVVVGAWLRTRRDGRVRWWLVPLVWVWAMLHGMWLRPRVHRRGSPDGLPQIRPMSRMTPAQSAAVVLPLLERRHRRITSSSRRRSRRSRSSSRSSPELNPRGVP